MQELLAESSMLAAASLLRPPQQKAGDESLQSWRLHCEALIAPTQPLGLKAVSLPVVLNTLEGLFSDAGAFEPQLIKHRDVLWLRGSGALYDGETGIAVPGSYLARGARQQDAQETTTFRVELRQSVHTYPRLENAVVLPSASCNNFREFITETLAFLWPFIPNTCNSWVHTPVLLNGCDADQPTARILHAILRDVHTFPLLDRDLPEAVHLEQVLVPEPSFRLQAHCTSTYLHTAAAMGDWLVTTLDPTVDTPKAISKVFVSRSGLSDPSHRVEGEATLEAILIDQGWTIFHPEQHPLAAQVAAYRSADIIAGFEGSALHGLSLLTPTDNERPMLIILGDQPSLDLCLQLKAQAFQGFFLHCTHPVASDQNSNPHLNHKLNRPAEQVAGLITELLLAS